MRTRMSMHTHAHTHVACRCGLQEVSQEAVVRTQALEMANATLHKQVSAGRSELAGRGAWHASVPQVEPDLSITRKLLQMPWWTRCIICQHARDCFDDCFIKAKRRVLGARMRPLWSLQQAWHALGPCKHACTRAGGRLCGRERAAERV